MKNIKVLFNSTKITGVLYISFFCIILFSPSKSNADMDARWQSNPGATIGVYHDRKTKVRMQKEAVTISLRKANESDWSAYEQQPKTVRDLNDEFKQEDLASPHYVADVSAVFTMYNSGKSAENFEVSFPLEYSTGHPLLDAYNFSVTSENKDIPTHNATAQNIGDETYSWESKAAIWPMVFPANKNTEVIVHYSVFADGNWAGSWSQNIGYVLDTGASWFDTIGDGTVLVIFPEGYNIEDAKTSGLGNIYPESLKKTMKKNTLEFSFSNLEPTADHNIYVQFENPSAWLRRKELLDKGDKQWDFEEAMEMIKISKGFSENIIAPSNVDPHSTTPSSAYWTPETLEQYGHTAITRAFATANTDTKLKQALEQVLGMPISEWDKYSKDCLIENSSTCNDLLDKLYGRLISEGGKKMDYATVLAQVFRETAKASAKLSDDRTSKRSAAIYAMANTIWPSSSDKSDENSNQLSNALVMSGVMSFAMVITFLIILRKIRKRSDT